MLLRRIFEVTLIRLLQSDSQHELERAPGCTLKVSHGSVNGGSQTVVGEFPSQIGP